MKKFILSLLTVTLLASLVVIGGCGQKTESQPTEKTSTPEKQSFEGQTLNLYVAAGMKKPMDETIELFQKETGATVVPNYGPSGGLYAQIEKGQPCDLYYSADWIYIEKAQQAGKVEKEFKFLRDNIVLVVSNTGSSKVSSLKDLAKPGVSMVIADPQAPVGVYSKKGLESLGLWDQVSANIKAMPTTVNQVAIMVKEDQVDAGLLYSSVANGNELKPIETIDTKDTGEIIFGAAVIKGNNTELAEAFMNFASKHVDLFEHYGWKKYE